MTPQHIKDNAPDGATHWLELGRYTDGSGYLIAYYVVIRNKLYFFEFGRWVLSEHTIKSINIKPL